MAAKKEKKKKAVKPAQKASPEQKAAEKKAAAKAEADKKAAAKKEAAEKKAAAKKEAADKKAAAKQEAADKKAAKKEAADKQPAEKKKQEKKKDAASKEEKQGLGKKIALIALCVLLVLAAGYFGASLFMNNSVIWKDTTVNEVALDGMTKEQAEEALTRKYEADYKGASFTVKIADQEFDIPVYDSLAIDFGPEIDRAYSVGHNDWYKRGYEWAYRKIKGTQPGIVLPHLGDKENLEEAIAASGIGEFSNEVETTWEQDGDIVVIHKGTDGVRADMEELEKKIAKTIESGTCSGMIECPEKIVRIAKVDYAPIANALYKKAQNPTLDPENNYAIVPAVTGVRMEVPETRKAYEEAAQGEDVKAVITLTAPSETTEEYEEKLFSEMLTAYNSYASTSTAKVTNQTIACETVDNTILMPGETFSYLGLIGDTTPEKGYMLENAYSDGNVVQEYGGGVCQISSTLFSAILYTNLEIVERKAHSMLVGYLPQGMDATVSYPSPDFKFRNNRNYPILIRTIYNGGQIRAEIYGTPEESDLTVDVALVTVGDLAVDTYRLYYDEDGNVVKEEFVCASRYKPVNVSRDNDEEESSSDDDSGDDDGDWDRDWDNDWNSDWGGDWSEGDSEDW